MKRSISMDAHQQLCFVYRLIKTNPYNNSALLLLRHCHFFIQHKITALHFLWIMLCTDNNLRTFQRVIEIKQQKDHILMNEHVRHIHTYTYKHTVTHLKHNYYRINQIKSPSIPLFHFNLIEFVKNCTNEKIINKQKKKSRKSSHIFKHTV